MKNFKWTKENINFLIENYSSKGAPYCALQLETSVGSVHGKANRLGIKSRKNQKRTHSEYEKELMDKDIDFVPLESYIDSHTPILHECFNNHISSIKPYSVLSGRGCKQCDTIDRTKTHEQYLIDLSNIHSDIQVIDQYKNSITPIRHSCSHGHIWWARPGSILNTKSHCPECANYSFKLTKPAILYYLKITKENLVYYKIGITTRSVKERFRTEPKSTIIKIIQEIPYTTGKEAKDEESRILQQYSAHRQNIPELLVSGGNTELFEFDVLGLDI